jgi:hypothetical protein
MHSKEYIWGVNSVSNVMDKNSDKTECIQKKVIVDIDMDMVIK